MLSYPDYWIWIIFNPESFPAAKLLTCFIYDFQYKWLSKENRENLVVLASAHRRGESRNGPCNRPEPENVSPRAEPPPRGADAAAVAAWGLLGAVHCREGNLVFLHKVVLPACLVTVPNHFHTHIVQVFISVQDFHLHWVLSWVSTDICMNCGLMLVFVASVPHDAACYALRRECVCPCKSWTLGS